MLKCSLRLHAILAFVVGMTALGPASGTARAQYGMGWGWGGFGGFNYVPSPTDFLNQHALVNAARGQQRPASHSVYAGNPNSYINRVRDNGFVPRYDVQRRRAPSQRSQPNRSLGNIGVDQAAAQPPPSTTAPKPVLPLASFFDVNQTLVWPSESPVEGELRSKRDNSDQASLAVLEETKKRGAASIGSVTDARQKLLDYGRPALQQIRIDQTPRIADTFHLFMLSLYESLAQATSPPDSISDPQPAP
jgi:hypothetical protein